MPALVTISPEALKLADALRIINNISAHGTITAEVRDGKVVMVEVTHKIKT